MGQDFLDLDVDAVCEIFSLKSEQEEVSDFSFSFGQTDLCEGLIAWMGHDPDNRWHLPWGLFALIYFAFCNDGFSK